LSGTIGIIQARMDSERLPGKVLAPLSGRPALALLVDRIRSARVSEWWLATSSDPSDDVTEAWGFELGLRVFRGETEDVLSRYVAIANETGADWVLRVSADSPFTDAPLIDALLDARDTSAEAKRADVLQFSTGDAGEETGDADDTAPSPALPTGYSVELIRSGALRRAATEIPAQEPHHRVHVTSWFAAQAQLVDVPAPIGWPDRRDWRWALDTYEDLAMARCAFRLFGDEAATIGYPEMVSRLDAHPEITSINTHVEGKALEEG
jgi:spore coat polysaccharide biosynthesis protein SpsF